MAPVSQVFKQDPKAIVHLRSQLLRKRLGLIFGAGISRDLAFPQWPALVTRIEQHKDVDATDIVSRCEAQSADTAPITRSLSTVTQMFFTRYREMIVTKKRYSLPLNFIQEQHIRTSWLKLIHSQLYKDADLGKRLTLIKSHPYLSRFEPLIKQAPLTVNYNFDDSLERMLYSNRKRGEKNKTRGYEVIDKPNAQFQKENSVIYHPNGYLPSTFEDGASPEVVFADDAFQDQLLSAANGRYLHLSNYLFANTCLLVGLSLNDATLQSLLRQNVVNNPGNIHYIVHFVPPGKPLDPDIRELIFNANFDSYNLYTLFLDSGGIAELAELISMDSDDFAMAVKRERRKYVYYVIGSVGAGKSTAASNFRSLITYEEWIDARRPGLAVPESELTPAEREELNEWVADQFMKKNFALGQCDEGIHLVDRCPLDPLTFGEATERAGKAEKLLATITSTSPAVEHGHIIYLECGEDEIRLRSTYKHKYWPRAKFRQLIKSIEEVYLPLGSLTRISTMGRSAGTVAKEIAKVIFLHIYDPVDVGEKLKEFAAPRPKVGS